VSAICYTRIGLTPEVGGPASRPNHALTCMVNGSRKPALQVIRIENLHCFGHFLSPPSPAPWAAPKTASPGADYAAKFSRNGTIADALSLSRSPDPSPAVPVAIDALLARNELTGLTCLPLARSESRLAANVFEIRMGT
jgi:hypothetical protein